MDEAGATSSARRYRLGGVEFDARTGEVRGGEGVVRLPPQPAQLLTMLIERRGELLTHEEIRGALWPGVRVEFDQSLHFCVRQIRSALGERAAEGSCIETLARRGYRLRVAPEVIDDGEAEGQGGPDDGAAGAGTLEGRSLGAHIGRRSRGRVGWGIAGALLVVAMVVGAVVWMGSGAPSGARVRVAIMPFAPPAAYDGPDPTPIATLLLAELGAREFEVVGPTSTERFGSVDATLRDLASELGVEYVINARFVRREGGVRLLAELIRASDGAHVWVRLFEDVSDADAVAREIGAGVRGELAGGVRAD